MYQQSSRSTNVQVCFCGFLILTIVGNGFQTCGEPFWAGRAQFGLFMPLSLPLFFKFFFSFCKAEDRCPTKFISHPYLLWLKMCTKSITCVLEWCLHRTLFQSYEGFPARGHQEPPWGRCGCHTSTLSPFHCNKCSPESLTRLEQEIF